MTPDNTPLGVADLERLRPGLRLMALRALGTVHAADEAAQETLARAVVALQKGQPSDPEHVAAFVSGIARHVIADACRARQRDVPLESLHDGSAAAGNVDALAAIISSAEQEAVRSALTHLPASDHELLRLCYFEGLGPSEIAARTGEPPERIRKRKSRALRRLREAFQRATGGHEGHGSPT